MISRYSNLSAKSSWTQLHKILSTIFCYVKYVRGSMVLQQSTETEIIHSPFYLEHIYRWFSTPSRHFKNAAIWTEIDAFTKCTFEYNFLRADCMNYSIKHTYMEDHKHIETSAPHSVAMVCIGSFFFIHNYVDT